MSRNNTPKPSRFKLPSASSNNEPALNSGISGFAAGASSGVAGGGGLKSSPGYVTKRAKSSSTPQASPRRTSIFKISQTPSKLAPGTPSKLSPIPNRLLTKNACSSPLSNQKLKAVAQSNDRIGAIVFSPRKIKSKVKSVSLVGVSKSANIVV